MINIKYSEKSRIPEAILSIWDDHYFPEDELFGYGTTKDDKEKMIKILNDHDHRAIFEMLQSKEGATLWDNFCLRASTCAGREGNRDYDEMCLMLAAKISYHYIPLSDNEYLARQSDYYSGTREERNSYGENAWPPASLGDLWYPEENWPDD